MIDVQSYGDVEILEGRYLGAGLIIIGLLERGGH